MTEIEIKEKSIELENEISGERERISTDRMDISFGELISLYKNQELVISPDYQRLFRWNLGQQTALIESLLLSIPIPPIFVSEDENVKYFTEHKVNIDLDDGVAVNYKKLEKILYKEPKITKSKED